MTRHRLSPEAQEDLLDLWEYIAADNTDAANHVIDTLFRAFDDPAEHPRTGHARPDLAGDRPLLFWPVGPFLIISMPDQHPLEIIAVTRAARDIPALLRSRQP